jgi:hypothetical protein
MVYGKDILEYNKALANAQREIAGQLCLTIEKYLTKAEAKVWHGHPVWFIGGNPIVGYSLKKSGIEVLFWSGQSFLTPGLAPVGKFKAAGFAVPDLESLDSKALVKWLKESKAIQWDYLNVVKKKKLEKLTDF